MQRLFCGAQKETAQQKTYVMKRKGKNTAQRRGETIALQKRGEREKNILQTCDEQNGEKKITKKEKKKLHYEK